MKKVLSAVLLLATSFAPAAYAGDETKAYVGQLLQQIAPRLTVESIDRSSIPGISEVVLSNGDILYVDPKAQAFMLGQMLTFSAESGLENVTEVKKREISDARGAERKTIIDGIAATDKITFSPTGEVKSRIHVFTDISCPYCVKLHREIPELNKLGIEVSYLAYPRAGQGSQAHRQMNAIWCAGDDEARRKAMTQAKIEQNLKGRDCKTPVMEQMKLGQAMGVTGTPALVLDDGKLVPGYVPAKKLAAMLGVN
ncbi:MAG: protein-disulfide isomerase [Neptuniibacter caesariensis]|uniref:Thiol:disulfide interchange protein n=1 Tax=Neptuniibacter caesariensis TaxID=207954 RepID=A0A2G6JBI3_NEPCE|nr:MAG: protein-disulfide isomerase [Neptuniibacter caesariensis]